MGNVNEEVSSDEEEIVSNDKENVNPSASQNKEPRGAATEQPDSNTYAVNLYIFLSFAYYWLIVPTLISL